MDEGSVDSPDVSSSRIPPKPVRAAENLDVPPSKDNYPYGKFLQSSTTAVAPIHASQSEPMLRSAENVDARRTRSTGYLAVIGYAILGTLIALASVSTIAGIVGLRNLKYSIHPAEETEMDAIYATRRYSAPLLKLGTGVCHKLPVHFSIRRKCLQTSLFPVKDSNSKSIAHVTCRSNSMSGCKTILTAKCEDPNWYLLKMNSLNYCDACSNKRSKTSRLMKPTHPAAEERKTDSLGPVRLPCDQKPPDQIKCAKVIDDDEYPIKQEKMVVNYMCEQEPDCEVAFTMQCHNGEWKTIFNRSEVETSWNCEC